MTDSALHSILENYWATPADALAQSISSSLDGLTTQEAANRLSERVSVKKHWHEPEALVLFLEQFKSPICLLLLGAAALSYFLGERMDTIIITLIVLASGLLSFWQEYGARTAVAKMLTLIETKCTVIRDKQECSIPSKDVITGDVIVLSAGATIPADSIILQSKDLFVDEAALTGETFPVEKHAGTVAADTALAARSNCVFTGTHVVSGSATVLAVNTGDDTEFGKVCKRLSSKPPETDFERGIREFGYLLIQMTLVLVLSIFALNVFMQRPVLDSFMFSLALAVGLTPQLLPAIISINLSTGARRMAQEKVIVKRLSSIESFGSMNVLCSDKTGTITEGAVRLKAMLSEDGKESERVKLLAYLNSTMETGFVNPIDQALRDQVHLDISNYTKVDEVPYDFKRKRLTILVGDKQNPGAGLLVSKGALAQILEICTLNDAARSEISRIMDQLSNEGNRVLGVASKAFHGTRINASEEHDMTFEGFLVFTDPPKPGIADTIKQLNNLGVTLKIITGDNRQVATAVARQVGFAEPKVLAASELRNTRSEAIAMLANSTDVFAEVEPNQKEAIILALKKAGNVVGYVGDGINDAPALHAADVGISVNNAVDVAKEAAQLVMLEHELSVLVAGIREGRKTFANTLKYVFMATSANFGNMFSMAGASLFLPFLPLLPHQILLTNFLTDFPEMTIATDNVDEETIARPRRWDIKFVRSFMLSFGTLSSLFDYLTFFVLIAVMHAQTHQFRTGWFMESVVSAALIVLIIRTRHSSLSSRPSAPLLYATLGTIAVVILLPYTPLATPLGFSPLPPQFVLTLVAIVAVYSVGAEILKHIFYKRHS